MLPSEEVFGVEVMGDRGRIGWAGIGVLLVTICAYAEPIDFNRDIRPILSDKCFRCHGPDAGERVSALRLDQRQSVLAELDDGSRAVVPGDMAASQLWQRITSADADWRMPPPASGQRLSDDERQRLGAWIEAGATWSDHWAFQPPRRPALPAVQRRQWMRNAIDAFVLARLERAGISPSNEASRTSLIRRVTFDLTGLPPTPAEVTRFLADRRPDAYERLVDRLLNSPRYGEHQARYWLDVARYGDTHGLHLDNERSIWPYRDWVIRAFNRNQPFDRFTIEQLAGDLLPSPSLDQRVATGFHRCNVTTSEGGSIDQEYLVRYAADRVETTATAWMGLTVGCAACHDHKFDPISQAEFYGLFAYFFSLTERAMDGNALLPPPSVKAPTPVQALRDAALEIEIAAGEAEAQQWRDEAEPKLTAWCNDFRTRHPLPPIPSDVSWHCTLDETNDARQARVAGGSAGQLIGRPDWDAAKIGLGLRFDGDTHIEFPGQNDYDRLDAFSATAWVYLDGEGPMTVLSRMDDAAAHRGYDFYLADGRLFVHLIHAWDRDAIRVNTTQPLVKQKWQHIAFTYDGSSRADGVRIYLDGELQELTITHDRLTGSIRTEQPFRIGRRSQGGAWRGMLDEVRIYGRVLSGTEVRGLAGVSDLEQLIALPASQLTSEQRRRLIDHFLKQNDPSYRELRERTHRLKERRRRLRGSFPSTLVMQELSRPRPSHVLLRGQYDQPGQLVQPGVPAVLPELPPDAAPNRLSLARWLVDSSHPLTARVTVNRFWQRYFGTGLVATAEDFGSQGEWPSHPSLLDWLAVELVASGWNVKAMHRLLVTSATYRQSSSATPAAFRRDPSNRLLGRGPRFRLDAEAIRDQALALSGLLVERIGGKGVRPYQPKGLWEAVGYTSSNTARFRQDQGASLYRRSLYTFWKRTSPPPTMQILDAPSREVCTVRRPRTNTPAAALALMNDVQFVEAARQLAQRLCRSAESDHARLELGFRMVTARPPERTEMEVLVVLLRGFRRQYGQDRAAARELLQVGESRSDEAFDIAELAAWTMVANTLLNLDEAITKS